MGIIDRFFKKDSPQPREPDTMGRAEIIGDANNHFTPWDGDAWTSDIYRAGVDAIARNAAKLKGSHIIQYKDHGQAGGDCRIDRILQVSPNRFMNAYSWLYQIIGRLYLYGNSFSIIDRDAMGNMAAVYPVGSNRVDFLADATDRLYCKFYFDNGKALIIPYQDVIHLRRHFNSHSLLGDDNTAIMDAVNLANMENQGIAAGIENGAHIRGILKVDQVLNDTRLAEVKKEFTADYLGMANSGGVITVDKKMDYQPIEMKPVILDADQSKAIRSKVYNYLGISEAIVNSTYNEDQWAAFYESVIEPLAIQLGLEFTAKLFTDRERAFGNTIIFESGRLQFASYATKTTMLKELMPMGLFTVNEARELLNLPSVEDGDRRLQTLNVVSADKADDYQMDTGNNGDTDTSTGGNSIDTTNGGNQ